MTTGKFDAKVAELDQSLSREKQLEAEVARLKQEIARLQQSLEESRKKNDIALAAIGELKERLAKLGQNVDQLASEKGQLTAGLQDAEKRLEELRRQKAAAEARAATFRGLVEKLRSMIDAGQLKVSIRNGRMLIVLPNDVLFDSGRTDLRVAGQATLKQVAAGAGGDPGSPRFWSPATPTTCRFAAHGFPRTGSCRPPERSRLPSCWWQPG